MLTIFNLLLASTCAMFLPPTTIQPPHKKTKRGTSHKGRGARKRHGRWRRIKRANRKGTVEFIFQIIHFGLTCVLRKEIQSGHHTAEEDASTTMELYQTVKEEWEGDVREGRYLFRSQPKRKANYELRHCIQYISHKSQGEKGEKTARLVAENKTC